jgi:hypothetical protein
VLQNGGDSTTRERRKVIVAFCPKLEASPQSPPSTRQHDQSHRGTPFLVQAMAGGPVSPAAAARTPRWQAISDPFAHRPLRRQDILFALCSSSDFKGADFLSISTVFGSIRCASY